MLVRNRCYGEFRIADALTVETRSVWTGERSICRAEKSKLSLKVDRIQREIVAPTGQPGMTIVARIAADSHINVQQARNDIAEFVSLVKVPVDVKMGKLESETAIDVAAPVDPVAHRLPTANQRSSVKRPARGTPACSL